MFVRDMAAGGGNLPVSYTQLRPPVDKKRLTKREPSGGFLRGLTTDSALPVRYQFTITGPVCQSRLLDKSVSFGYP